MYLTGYIHRIEELLKAETEFAAIYAALECRLAIEHFAYERLRQAHDYISHDDLKKWKPADIVKVLISEVDELAAQSFTLRVAIGATEEIKSEDKLEYVQNLDYKYLGEHIGFSAAKLNGFWHALSNLALHISLPETSDEEVRYASEPDAIKTKVHQALEELKRLNTSTVYTNGFGKEVAFNCICGKPNKRRMYSLTDGKIVSCIDSHCSETYVFRSNGANFERRTLPVICKHCENLNLYPARRIERTSISDNLKEVCLQCGNEIIIRWQPMYCE